MAKVIDIPVRIMDLPEFQRWAAEVKAEIERLTQERDEALVALARGLEWALYWIRTHGEVPLPLEEQDEWERWEEASRALRKFGPESGYAIEAYRRDYRRRREQG